MNLLVQLSWALLALIHLMPALAFVRPALLTQLYGVKAGEATFLLLHHRAALFLAVLLLCLWSIFASAPRPAAAVATAISMLTFLLLYLQAASILPGTPRGCDWQERAVTSIGVGGCAASLTLPSLLQTTMTLKTTTTTTTKTTTRSCFSHLWG